MRENDPPDSLTWSRLWRLTLGFGQPVLGEPPKVCKLPSGSATLVCRIQTGGATWTRVNKGLSV